MSKEHFKETLFKLVETFERNKTVYKDRKSNFNEAQLREQFINPMFKALGWDMNNEEGFAEQYKEVVHEDKVYIKGKPKAPDYSFRIGGQRKFFLEAKQPFVRIKSDFDPALQLRRYAWSAHLPISILTDFEEFAVYDTTIEPKITDRASVGRIEYFTFDEYKDQWEKIYDLFSKEGIQKGSFDKYIAKEKKGKQLVDKVFLKELEKWREWLAQDIAKLNKDLNVEEINFSVQKIIDRIIFLRIAEDRGIEEYKTLQRIISSDNSYPDLIKYFHKAHDKYNSGLFDFDQDKITPNLKISDRILDKILVQLYYPQSPYEFSVIGVELLGSIYEQFLGKVIRLTSSHNAIIEDKPEVKKSGGVYYTPQYIVEYIVQNTVGELVKGKTPKQVESLTILDPACGSGSFLIGAYVFLLNWHLDYYLNTSEKEKEAWAKKGAIYKMESTDSAGLTIIDWQLTTAEKKKIMINNIYGVDIDSQAVEVTKLSLALKMLENENHESINSQMKLFAERILPDLTSNIKCGNSLVSEVHNETYSNPALNDEQKVLLRKFNWSFEYEKVFKKGKFDILIGNPPWGASISDFEKNIIELTYKTIKKKNGLNGSANTFSLFIERAANLIKLDGNFCFILPLSSTTTKSMEQIHDLLLSSFKDVFVSTFGERPAKIFENAEQPASIIIGKRFTGLYESKTKSLNTTGYIRWEGDEIEEIIQQLDYYHIPEKNINLGRIPKIGNKIEDEILNKINKFQKNIFDYSVNSKNANGVYYKSAGGRYYKPFLTEPQKLIKDGIEVVSTTQEVIYLEKKCSNKVFAALYSSSLFFMVYQIYSDMWHIVKDDLFRLKFNYDLLGSELEQLISNLYDEYYKDILKNSISKINKRKTGTIEYKEFYLEKSKRYTDFIDEALADYYGFSKEELDYIINFESRFRLYSSN